MQIINLSASKWYMPRIVFFFLIFSPEKPREKNYPHRIISAYNTAGMPGRRKLAAAIWLWFISYHLQKDELKFSISKQMLNIAQLEKVTNWIQAKDTMLSYPMPCR